MIDSKQTRLRFEFFTSPYGVMYSSRYSSVDATSIGGKNGTTLHLCPSISAKMVSPLYFSLAFCLQRNGGLICRGTRPIGRRKCEISSLYLTTSHTTSSASRSINSYHLQRFGRSSKKGTAFSFPFLSPKLELVPVPVPFPKSGTVPELFPFQ